MNRLVPFWGAVDPSCGILSQNPVSNTNPRDSLSNFNDIAYGIGHLDHWKFEIGIIKTLHHEAVSIIQRDSADFNQDVKGPRLRHWPLGRHEILSPKTA